MSAGLEARNRLANDLSAQGSIHRTRMKQGGKSARINWIMKCTRTRHQLLLKESMTRIVSAAAATGCGDRAWHASLRASLNYIWEMHSRRP